eukprot:7390497-Prymnesium_polylepis.1
MTLGVQNSSRRSESGSSERLRITGRLRIRVVSESIDRSVLGDVSMACHVSSIIVAYQSRRISLRGNDNSIVHCTDVDNCMRYAA